MPGAGTSAVSLAGVDHRVAGCTLTIDLHAIQENYRALAKVCAPARVAGVVKANAYGLGLEAVVLALVEAGCTTFFTALPDEGAAVGALAPDARVFVLNGLFGGGIEKIYSDHRLIPVINSPREATIWSRFCAQSGKSWPCAINVDTGMNRLGLTASEAVSLAEENQLTQSLDVVLVMSHLACSDEPKHPKNREQLESFQRVRTAFQGIESSLANSGGIFCGRDFHCDLIRPGIALYGGAPLAQVKNPMRTVAVAEARVAQVRRARAGETVSYGATTTLSRDTTIAVCAIGYADGYPRAGSGAGVTLRQAEPTGGHGWILGRRVPVLGRVTMDLTMFDVTDCGPDAVRVGDAIELFGKHLSIDEASRAAGTISYEMLTALGARYNRVYLGAEA